MNKHRYFKIKRIQDNNGDVVFKVYATDSWIAVLFNAWDEYNKDNNTISDAWEQIKSLHGWGIFESKTVFRTTRRKLDKKL